MNAKSGSAPRRCFAFQAMAAKALAAAREGNCPIIISSAARLWPPVGTDGANSRLLRLPGRIGWPGQGRGTREEDIQHDMYRPYWYDRISAGL